MYVFNPGPGNYDASSTSVPLPGIDLAALADCAQMEWLNEAVQEFRKRIQRV